MGNNLFQYKNKSIWIHDWWISLAAYFFLECINEGNYDEKLNPIKGQLVERLQDDIHGFLAGTLDLGTDIIIKTELIKPYLKSLGYLKDKISSQGEYLSSEKCKEIDDLNYDPHKNIYLNQYLLPN